MKKGKDYAAPGEAAYLCSRPEMLEHRRLVVGRPSQPPSPGSASAVISDEHHSTSPSCAGQVQQIPELRPSLFHGAWEPRWESSPAAVLEDAVLGVGRCGAEGLGLARHQPSTSCGDRGRPRCQAGGTARAGHQRCRLLASLQVGPREPGAVLRLGNARLIKE